jgi:hypothetical protein
MRIIEKIKRWYDGEWIPFKDPGDPSIFVIGGDTHYSTTARIARWFVGLFAKKDGSDPWWRRPFGIVLLVVLGGLIVAYCKMRWPQWFK